MIENSLSSRPGNPLKKVFILSLLVNILLVVICVVSFIRITKISQEIDAIQKQKEQAEIEKKSRTNGVGGVDQKENVPFEEIAKQIKSRELTLTGLENTPFTQTTLIFEETFTSFETKTPDGISISIEKINQSPPYLVPIHFTEWGGVQDIEPLVRHIIQGTEPDPTIYNTKINGIAYAKHWGHFPGTTFMVYETVQPSIYGDSYLHYQFDIGEDLFGLKDGDWKEIQNDPEKWFDKNPSAKFAKLEAFIRENIKKPIIVY